MKNRVLVVDDEETIRTQLKSRLEREGFSVDTADQGEQALRQCGQVDYSVVVTDLKMPGKDGVALLESLRTKPNGPRVILITGHGEKDIAVQALRKGASDYLEKPFDLDQLSQSVKRAAREAQLERENSELVERLEARVQRVEGKAEDQFWFVSRSTSMSKVNEWLTVLRREAMRDAEEPTVLILGASGTGKEGIARMVHAGSRRGKGPWVAVNCANFSEELLESELFGHERGAFTGALQTKRGLFEIAKAGTLFLDEIGEMDLKLQAKLLRVLQERVFRRVGGTQDLDADVRVIAATNRNLEERVKVGRFRDDLFHRINRVVIDLPNLKDRTEDLLPMAQQFAERAFGARGKKFPGFSPEVQVAFRNYSWPGNVRELLNVVERAALVWEGGGALLSQQVSLGSATQTGFASASSRSSTGLSLVSSGQSGATSSENPTKEQLLTPGLTASGTLETYTHLKKRWSEQFEKEYLVAALGRHHGNVSAAAREARLDRSNFLRLLRKYGLKAQGYRPNTGDVGPVSPPVAAPVSAPPSTDKAA
jgi:DNA-binding NtrC family response regulator